MNQVTPYIIGVIGIILCSTLVANGIQSYLETKMWSYLFGSIVYFMLDISCAIILAISYIKIWVKK